MITGIHIEPTNICTLKCPGCARTQFINQWNKHWLNQNLDIDVTLNFLDIDLKNVKVLFCGNYGDPIYHPDFIEFVRRIKQRQAYITIITNGSYKKPEWWNELVSFLDDNDTIIFSIDGTPDNFTQYRINANWDSIEQAIKICVNSTVKTKWKYIPFKFNENSIDEAKQLSEHLGIDEFYLDPSDRYDQSTEYLKPSTEEYIGSRYQAQSEWQKNKINSVNPKCSTGKEHFITAEGFYSPCCYITDHRFYYKNQFGKNKKEYNINDCTITDLLASPKVIEFYKTLDQQSVCQFNCPA